MGFYNTTNLISKILAESKKKVNQQDHRVLQCIVEWDYKSQPHITPWLIWVKLKKSNFILIGSVRRSVNTLKKYDLIEYGDNFTHPCPEGGFETTEKSILFKSRNTKAVQLELF